ncbi:MAG: tetratricopeptide repeat protein [Alphaproteobacteria bacterium]|nr:tetratricopeptide repeat protein [Alphaproteobacteria bacterium]
MGGVLGVGGVASAQSNTPLLRLQSTPHASFGRVQLIGDPTIIAATTCTVEDNSVVLTAPEEVDINEAQILLTLGKYIRDVQRDPTNRVLLLVLRPETIERVACLPPRRVRNEGRLIVDLLARGGESVAEPSVSFDGAIVQISFALDEPAVIDRVTTGENLTIGFRQPVTMSLSALADQLGTVGVGFPRFVDVQNRRLEIPLAPLYQPYNVRFATQDNTVTVSLVPPQAAAAQPDLVEVPITLLQTKAATRFVFNWPIAVNVDTAHDGGVLSLQFSRPGYLTVDLLDTAAAFPREFGFRNPRAQQGSGAGAGVRFLLDVPADYNYNTWRRGQQILLEVEHKSVDQRLVNLAPQQERELSLRPTAVPPDELGSVGFLLPENITLAAFAYGGSHWLVIGARFSPNLLQLSEIARPFVTAVEQIDHPTATVLRFITRGQPRGLITKRLFQWHYSFYRDPQPLPPENLRVVPLGSIEVGSDILVVMPSPGATASFIDPETGDRLLVGMTGEERGGVRVEQSWPDFQMLNTIQGLVIRESLPTVTLEPHREGFRVVREGAAGRVGGGRPESVSPGASPQADDGAGDAQAFLPADGTAEPVVPETSSLLLPLTERDVSNRQASLLGLIGRRRTFDLFTAEHNYLTQSYGNYLESERPAFWLDMLHFFLSEGLGHEAVATHEIIRSKAPEQANTLPALLGRYAGLVLARKYVQAEALLRANPSLREYDETHIWLGVNHTKHRRFQLAEQSFLRGDVLLNLYPQSLQREIAPDRIRVAIAQGNSVDARDWIERLTTANLFFSARHREYALRLNVGLFDIDEGNTSRAKQVILEMANDRDVLWGLQAAVDGFPPLYAQDALESAEAIETLRHLLFGWDDGLLAVQGRQVLGCFYLLSGDYASGLAVYRNLLASLENDPNSLVVARNMSQIFIQTLLSPEEYGLQSQEALELFLRFRELIPAGEEGARLIESLADRLARIEAYDVALDLVGNRLYIDRHQGVERRRVIVKAALLEMLGGQYEEAVTRLQSNDFGAVELDRYQREARLLRAYGLQRLERTDEALALLVGDVSFEADRLRANIYWRGKQWQEVASVMQRLVANDLRAESGLTAQSELFLIRWGLALSLLGDEDGLTALSNRFRADTASSAYAEVFAFLFAPRASLDATTIARYAVSLASADRDHLQRARTRYIREAGAPAPSRVDFQELCPAFF